MNLLLIGYRASGKSTIGARVAEELAGPFVDLDAVALAGFPEATVKQVWSNHGEGAWRAAELKALSSALKQPHQVIALGGGTPTIATARQLITRHRTEGRARCAYLHCDVVELARRLSADEGDRPSLTGAGTAREIAAVLADREGFYRELADVELDVTAISVKQAAAALVQTVRTWNEAGE